MVSELCEKVSKIMTVVKELRAEHRREFVQKPEEIEMDVFWRQTVGSIHKFKDLNIRNKFSILETLVAILGKNSRIERHNDMCFF